jgi:hypothetical protein
MGCVCSSIQMALKKCCTGLSASELGERGICDRSFSSPTRSLLLRYACCELT